MAYYDTLKNIVRVKFPTVRDFRIEEYSPNHPVIEYYDVGAGRRKSEYPPVCRWRVGSTNYVFIAKPTFINRHVKSWFGLVHRNYTEVSYTGEDDKLMEAIGLSVEGKTGEEINQIMGRSNDTRRSDCRC